MGDEFIHKVEDDVYEGTKEVLMQAKKMAEEVFGEKCRNRDVFMAYELLMQSIHCEHEPKEPWQR